MGSFWDHFEIILGSFGDNFGINLGLLWGDFGFSCVSIGFSSFLSKLSVLPKGEYTLWKLSHTASTWSQQKSDSQLGILCKSRQRVTKGNRIGLLVSFFLLPLLSADRKMPHGESFVVSRCCHRSFHATAMSTVCGPEDASRRVFRRQSLLPLLFPCHCDEHGMSKVQLSSSE